MKTVRWRQVTVDEGIDKISALADPSDRVELLIFKRAAQS